MSSVKVKALYAILCFTICGALLAAVTWYGLGDSQAAPAPTPATEVDVAKVLSKSVSDWQSYSGRLQAIDYVDVRALVSGTITAVYFRDGQLVKKGDPLFLIDPRPYQAAVDRAAAELDAAEAREKFASADYERANKLIASNAMSKRDFDEKNNGNLEAKADVHAAEATLEGARVNLGYTRIVAPVSGRTSRAELTFGNIVSAGAASPRLTTLVSVSPIYAAFDVDEQTYLNYIAKDTAKQIDVRLGLANESGYSRSGKLFFVDNQLNSGAGTIRVRAIFDNVDGALVPGLYARVAVDGGSPHEAVLIDDRAISTDQAKKFVLVVDANSKVQYREVVPGLAHGGFREIQSGLSPGERIVVSGLQLVHPGDAVKVNLVPMSGEQVQDK